MSRRKGVIPNQETRDKLSVSMRGNKNAVGAIHIPKKKKPKLVDHAKILKRFTKTHEKESYNKVVAKSAALLMFSEASHEERVEIMKRVNREFRKR